MEKQPRHRPRRHFADARRIIVECELERCVHCGQVLAPRRAWHMRKTVQTLQGPVFVAGKSKRCVQPGCAYYGRNYYAHRTALISLPYSTYGLDVLGFIGWQHEHEHRQLVEIQRMLNERGIRINERTVGKLYRQFLALLGAMTAETQAQLAQTAAQHGGLIWALAALQPEGQGPWLYVLYEVLGKTPVSALQMEGATIESLGQWLAPYQSLPYPVLATLSDGEKVLVGVLKACWPDVPHQLCQVHFLNNLAEPVLAIDTQLRKQMRADLGGLSSTAALTGGGEASQVEEGPPFFRRTPPRRIPS